MNNYLYKIIIAFSFLFIIISNSNSNEIDCNNFEKLSAKYIECNTNKLKKKVNENFKSSKKNIEESE